MAPIRDAICEVCTTNGAKYCCPKCDVKTCCLLCVNIHKKELNCDGVRNKTKFVYLPNFTNLDLLSDYKFLESTSRYVYDRKRNINKRYTNYNKDLPLYQHRLKKAARKHGTILLFLLQNFSRHRINSTRFNYKDSKIYWHIEWIFINAHPLPAKFYDGKCCEEDKVSKILDKYFNPSGENSELISSLIYYRSAGLNRCRFLLRAERIKSCKKRYYELDIRKSIKYNLAGKCIIEYPTIIVILDDHSYDLNVIDSDEELGNLENNDSCHHHSNSEVNINSNHSNESQQRESFTIKFAKQQKLQIEREITESQKRIPKNYLISSEYSSDEGVVD